MLVLALPSTNLLIIDNVTRPFKTGVVMTHFSNNATHVTAPISVPMIQSKIVPQ